MRKGKIFIAIALAVMMTVTLVPQVAGAQTAAVAESPSVHTFETDFDALVQSWRRYPKLTFGLDDKEWIVCGKQDDELVMICDPSDSYGKTVFGDDTYSGKYETSKVDRTLQRMTQGDSGVFSRSELSLMKDVSVTLIGDYSDVSGSRYQITRKLYTPYPNEGTVKVGTGTRDSMGDIQLSLSDSRFKGASFWTRAVNRSDVYKYENGSQVKTTAADTSDIVPVMHLNLGDSSIRPLFVSAAEPGKEDAKIDSTAKIPSPEDTTLTMRYDGEDKVKYTAEYNSNKVVVKCNRIVSDEYLYVQWAENGNSVNRVKSFKLEDYKKSGGGETTFTAEQIGGSGFRLNDKVKVWVEKKADNITYAKMGSVIKDEGPEVPDLTMTRSTNGKSNGSLSGLDADVEYEYCLENKVEKTKDWKTLPKGSEEISDLCSGNYYIRSKATETTSPGPEKMYRVKDIYDVTTDPDTGKLLINENDISTYEGFAGAGREISYSSDSVTATLERTAGFTDSSTAVEILKKHIKGGIGETDTDGTVKEMEDISAKLSDINDETSSYTKGLVGDIDAAGLKKLWLDATDALGKVQTDIYSSGDSKLQGVTDIYTGGLADRNRVDNIDSALSYFYLSEPRSVLTGKEYEDSGGTEGYTDFTALGDVMLNAAPDAEGSRDIFTLYEGVCSQIYNFNVESFSLREQLYKDFLAFYEKGYAALETATAYDVSLHQIQLDQIQALRQDAVNDGSDEKLKKFMDSLSTIAQKTTEVYGKDCSDWSRLEAEHQKQISAGKERLKKLSEQYKSVKAAYEKAVEKLQSEKELYTSDVTTVCYRNGVKYNTNLQLKNANGRYVNDFKSTKVTDFFECTNRHIKNSTKSIKLILNVLPKYTVPDRTDAVASAAASELNLLKQGSEARGMSFDEQMGKVFSILDADTGERMKFSDFSSCSKYRSTLGYFINGKQSTENKATFKEYLAKFYRDVEYFAGGERKTLRTVNKNWKNDMTVSEADNGEINKNEVIGDRYVIHLNRAGGGGRGGDAGCFMVEGKAKGAANVISWNEVEEADGYDVYCARCGKTMKKVKSTSALKYTKKNLNKKKAYKYRVRAYTVENGRKQYIDMTPVIHIAGTGTAYSNALSVDINKDYLNMEKGKTVKLKGSIVKKSSKKPVLWKNHVKSKLRYMSGDKSVVTVDSKGNVTAKAPGYTYVYVYAASGAYCGIEVTVE